MEEQQGIDINDVALDNIVPMDGQPEPQAPVVEAPPQEPTPEVQPDSTPTEPAPEPEQEPTGTGEFGDPIKITTDQEPEAEPTGEPQAEPEAAEPGEFNQEEQAEIFNEHLGYYTEGKIQSLEDINNLVAENERLRNQPKDPEFTSESAKKLFEFAQNSANPLAMGKNYLQAIALDVDTLNDKQKLFEAYVLDEQNSDLTREQAIEIFNEEFEEKYGDAEDSIMSKRKLTLDVRSAESKIKSLQEEAMEAPTKEGSSNQPTQEQIDEIYGEIDNTISQVESISIGTGLENGDFNFAVESQENLQSLADACKDPNGWIQEKINSFQQDGNFNYDDFTAFMATLVFAEQISEGMFKHGQNFGKKAVVKGLQNPQTPGQSPSTLPTNDGRSLDEKIFDKLEEKMQGF